MRLQMLRKFSAGLLTLLLIQPYGLMAQSAPNTHRQLVSKYQIPTASEPALSQAAMIDLLQKKIKYVFVLYQENRSFDSYFGTFPGAEGIYSHPAAQTPGYTQQ